MSTNHFELLGLTVNYEFDKKELTDNYRKLQAQFHPDNFSHSSDMEKRLSVQHSSQINDAYQTIKEPLRRAIYLLSLLGMELKNNETTIDSIFLMEQMELREKLDDISHQAYPLVALEVMSGEISKNINDSIKSISQLFNTDKQHINLDEIKNTIVKMQFLYKLQQQCEDLEEDLENQF